MKEELKIQLPAGIRRMARVLGLPSVIYNFLRLTFIGEFISSALSTRSRSSHPFGNPNPTPSEEAILESK